MKTGRTVPPLLTRYRPFAGINALPKKPSKRATPSPTMTAAVVAPPPPAAPAPTKLPRSAKALATNAKVRDRAIARNPESLVYGGVPLERALYLDRIPQVPGEQGFTLDFLRRYYAAPNSIINSQDGKPMRKEGREDYFRRILQWQLGAKTHPTLERPLKLFWGEKRAAYEKAVKTVAAAALAATGAHFLGKAVMGQAATNAAAVAGAAPSTAAAVGAATEVAASSLLPAVQSVVAATTGITIPTTLSAASLTQLATEVAMTQTGGAMRAPIENAIARQQAALAAGEELADDSSPGGTDYASLAGWAILALVAVAAASRAHRR